MGGRPPFEGATWDSRTSPVLMSSVTMPETVERERPESRARSAREGCGSLQIKFSSRVALCDLRRDASARWRGSLLCLSSERTNMEEIYGVGADSVKYFVRNPNDVRS